MSIRYMRQVIAERGIYDGAKFLKEQGATLDEVYLAAFKRTARAVNRSSRTAK